MTSCDTESYAFLKVDEHNNCVTTVSHPMTEGFKKSEDVELAPMKDDKACLCRGDDTVDHSPVAEPRA